MEGLSRKRLKHMQLLVRMLLAVIVPTVAQVGTSYGAETVRVAVQKTERRPRELAARIRAHGLDKQST